MADEDIEETSNQLEQKTPKLQIDKPTKSYNKNENSKFEIKSIIFRINNKPTNKIAWHEKKKNNIIYIFVILKEKRAKTKAID